MFSGQRAIGGCLILRRQARFPPRSYVVSGQVLKKSLGSGIRPEDEQLSGRREVSRRGREIFRRVRETRPSRHCSLGHRLRAGRDQRIARRVTDATRCGTFGRKDGRNPGRAAIGHEQHLIVAAQRRAIRCIAVRADDPHRGGRAGGTGRSRRPATTELGSFCRVSIYSC
jgi:hypothetical protein